MSENRKPIENIIHRTASRPFALYHTIVEPDETSALYLHCHAEAELFYLEEGQVDFIVENQTYRMVSRDAIFIPPNLIHHAVCTGPQVKGCRFYAFVFDVKRFEQYLPAYCHTYFAALEENRMECVYPIFHGEKQNGKLLDTLSGIFTHMQEPLDRYELALNGELFLCWQELYNLHFAGLCRQHTGKQILNELRKSIDYCHEHYAEPLTLAILAGQAGQSESYYCREFREYTGQPPFEYLNRIRIIRSCEYLAESDKKITEIAMLCGFNNISYYNRIFRRIMGMRPTDYRRQFR